MFRCYGTCSVGVTRVLLVSVPILDFSSTALIKEFTVKSKSVGIWGAYCRSRRTTSSQGSLSPSCGAGPSPIGDPANPPARNGPRAPQSSRRTVTGCLMSRRWDPITKFIFPEKHKVITRRSPLGRLTCSRRRLDDGREAHMPPTAPAKRAHTSDHERNKLHRP